MDVEREEDKAVPNSTKSLPRTPALDGASEIVARVRDASPVTQPQASHDDSLLHTVIQHMQDAVLLVDTDCRVVAINDAAIRDFGLPRDCRGSRISVEHISRVVSDGLTGRPLDEDSWLVGRVLKGEAVEGDPRVISSPDGTRRDFLMQCSPIFDSDGQVAMGLIVGWDVTPIKELQKQAEAALADATAQHENLRRVIDNMVAGVILVDSRLRVVAFNDAYVRMVSSSFEMRVGMSLSEIPGMGQRHGAMGQLRIAMDTGHPVSVQKFRVDGFGDSPKYLNCSAVPVQVDGENGPEAGLAILYVDVTEEVVAREQLEELAVIARHRARKLEEDRARLRTIIQSTPVPLFVVSRDRAVQVYNSAALNLSRELGMGQWIERKGSFREVKGIELLDEEGDPVGPRRDPLTRSLRGETCSGQVLQVRMGSGPFKWLVINSAPLDGTRGYPSGAVLAIHDVTEERLAQEQLAQVYQREHTIAEKLQTSFLPGGFSGLAGFEIGRSYQTALDEALVGGDFYDIFRLAENRLGLVVADVAGKGLRAAVYTAMTKYMLRAYALEESAPELVLARLNEALTACTPPEVFVTLIYGTLDAQTRSFTYANAGHEQPILCSDGMAVHLDVTGRALGLMHGSSYTTRQVDMRLGDVIIIHTDGITDAGTGPDRLGPEAMLKIAERNADQSAQAISDGLLSAAMNYCETGLSDDAAVLVIKAVGHED